MLFRLSLLKKYRLSRFSLSSACVAGIWQIQLRIILRSGQALFAVNMQRGHATGGTHASKESAAMRNRKLYPANWQEIATACKQRAGWRCQHCRVKQRVWRCSKRTGRRYRVYLQACHKNHLDRPKNDAELLCLCFTCHARYDYQHSQRLADIRLHNLKHRKLLGKEI